MKELFEILRVDKEISRQLVERSKIPHPHNYEEIIVVVKGEIEHFIDFESKLLQAPFVSFITKGKPHHIKPKDNDTDSEGYVIRFQSEFVSETIFQLYHMFHDNANVVFSSGREFKRFVKLCEMLHDEAQQTSPNFSIISGLLNILLTILEYQKRISLNKYESKIQHSQYIKFLHLLEENYHRPINVSFYADELNMTSRNLNIICQKILQKSMNDIIQTRRLTKAKSLLATTDKSISEIGFEIGYKEKSYFSHVFKRKTGKTPSEFRIEINSGFY